MKNVLLFYRWGLLSRGVLTLFLTGLAVLAPLPGAMAGEATEGQSQARSRPTADSGLPLEGAHKLTQLSKLMEEPVKNREGEEIGRISEIVIDKEGQVKYAVLAHGGMLGVGAKMTALAWELLEIAPEGKHYLLDVTEEQLAEAPTFDEENWPKEAQVTERRDFGTPAKEKSTAEESELMEALTGSSEGGEGAKSVTVREGETLSTLAERVYGDPEQWERIYEANQDQIQDPDHVPAGIQLTVPALEEPQYRERRQR